MKIKTFTITATAPTTYQLNALSAFGMGYKKGSNGSYTAALDFETDEEAKAYLRQRAALYNDGDPAGSEDRLAEMYADIEHGALRLDGVSAYIEESEKEVTYRIVVNHNDAGGNKGSINGEDEFEDLEAAMKTFKALDISRLEGMAYYELERWEDGQITPFLEEEATPYGYKAGWIIKD